MNTTNQNNNVTAAPSVTIAPRNPAKGVLNFVVTLTTHKDVRSYPFRPVSNPIGKRIWSFMNSMSRFMVRFTTSNSLASLVQFG